MWWRRSVVTTRPLTRRAWPRAQTSRRRTVTPIRREGHQERQRRDGSVPLPKLHHEQANQLVLAGKLSFIIKTLKVQRKWFIKLFFSKKKPQNIKSNHKRQLVFYFFSTPVS